MSKKIGLRKVLSLLSRFAKEIHHADRKRLFITILVFIALPLSSIVFDVLLLHYLLDVCSSTVVWSHFVSVMLVVLVFQVLVWMIEGYYIQYYSENSNLKINQFFYEKILNKINNTPFSQFEKPDFYDRYYFVTNTINARVGQYMSLIEQLVSSLVMFCTISTVIFINDPFIFFFVITPLVFEYLLSPYINKLRIEYNKKMSNEQRRGDYTQRVIYLKEYAKELRTTKIKNILFYQYDQFVSRAKELINIYGFRIGILQILIDFSFQIISYIGVIIYISTCVCTNEMELSIAIVIIGTFNSVIYSFKNIVDIYMNSMEQALYIEEMFSFIEEPLMNKAEKGNIPFPSIIESIEFKNVSYSYPNSKNKALKNVNFKLRRGERIAVLGPNGAGKSTIIKLIMRLYSPTSGEILLNGTNIECFSLDHYRKKITSVKQDFVIFSTDLERNILFHSINTSEDKERYLDAIKKSGFMERHQKLKMGSKSIISKEFDEQGEVLSGGEMQKIAIARGIANESDVVVMDEPTSALDPISENDFLQMIYSSFKDRILILVSHSFSLSKSADQILFFMDGKLIENGTHDELIKRNGEYSRFFRKQSDCFE